MKVVDWHPEDLIDRALADELSGAERAELDAHLEVCAACRFEALVVGDLEDEARGANQPDVAHMVLAAVAIETPAEPALRSRTRRASMGLIFGAAILVAGSAAALYRATRAAAPEAPAAPAALAPLPALAPAPPEATATHDHPHVEPAPSTASVPPVAAPEPRRDVTAATLFASANEARRGGERSRALSLYRELQRRFPDSPEAKLSHATVGRMMLDDEDPAKALEGYDGYLKEGDGALGEEALVGRATALGRLGRRDEERAAWHELLARHPQSLHAARARARLAELGAAK